MFKKTRKQMMGIMLGAAILMTATVSCNGTDETVTETSSTVTY